MRPLLVPAVLLGLAACGGSPNAAAARDYVTAIDPLLQENGLLADRLLVAAGGLHDEKLGVPEVGAVWAGELVPLAAHLHAQAELVPAPVAWAERQRALATIWGDRAKAYAGIAAAWEAKDPAGWKESAQLAFDAKVREESWMRETNTELRPYGLVLDQFP